jgi:hypothetical protein
MSDSAESAHMLYSLTLAYFQRTLPGQLQPERNAAIRKEIVKVKVTVKGGTPEGCESLWRSCTRGHIITGFRVSEEEVFCRTFFVEREIHFPVRECTFYEDKRLATKQEMEEIAWHLRSTNGKPLRNLGFVARIRTAGIPPIQLPQLPQKQSSWNRIAGDRLTTTRQQFRPASHLGEAKASQNRVTNNRAPAMATRSSGTAITRSGTLSARTSPVCAR